MKRLLPLLAIAAMPNFAIAESSPSQLQPVDNKVIHKHVSDEIIMLRAESVMNASSTGMKIKVLKIDRETKNLQIAGLLPILIQVTYENVPDVTEPINTVIYASKDGEAFVPGIVNDKNGGIYGLGMVRKQLAEQQKYKALNPTYQTNSNPSVLVGKTEKAITQGKGLKLGQDGLELSTKSGTEKKLPVIKKAKKENVSVYQGKKVTPTTFWNDTLANTNYISDGKKGAPVFYVFFDPWCSACHKFFTESRDLVANGKVEIRWIGFGIMQNYPGHPVGRSSLEAVAKIYSAKDKTAAFRSYMGQNIMPDVEVDKSLEKELNDHIRLERFVTNGGNPTPTAIFKSKNNILGVKIGIAAPMISVIIKSEAYNDGVNKNKEVSRNKTKTSSAQ